jgi:hypothetical protein
MRQIRRLVFALTVTVVALGGLATSATAASPQAAGGIFLEGPELILEEREANGNLIIHLTREAVITGTYTGVGQADQYIVIHPDGSFNFHQTIAFTGVACGQPVALTFEVVGRGDFAGNALTGTYSVIGPVTAGRGNGVIMSEPGVGGSYEGQVHCG